MKQSYIKPEQKEKNILPCSMMTSSNLYSSDKEADDSEILSNRRRGSWGNLWMPEEEED